MRLSGLLFPAAALLMSTQAAASVFVGGLFVDNQSYGATFADGTRYDDQDQRVEQVFQAPATLDATTSAGATAGSAAGDFSATTRSRLDFSSPGSLTFAMDASRSLFNTPGQLSFAGTYANLGYSFTTDTAYHYSLSFDLANSLEQSTPAGFLGLIGPNGYLFFQSLPLNGNGSYSGTIGPGNYYLQLNPAVVGDSFFYSPGRVDATSSARFAFNLSAPVPEPGTWLLFILGIGLVAAHLRQRRAVRSYRRIEA